VMEKKKNNQEKKETTRKSKVENRRSKGLGKMQSHGFFLVKGKKTTARKKPKQLRRKLSGRESEFAWKYFCSSTQKMHSTVLRKRNNQEEGDIKGQDGWPSAEKGKMARMLKIWKDPTNLSFQATWGNEFIRRSKLGRAAVPMAFTKQK